MVHAATYEALAPALLHMFQLGQQVDGIRLRHLLALYPEKLESGLKLYLRLQVENPESVEAYMEARKDALTELSSHVALDEDLRANLGSALGIVLNALSKSSVHGDYLATLNSLNKKPMYSRLLLMLVLLCAYLPKLDEAEDFEVSRALDLLLRDSAVHLTHLMQLAADFSA